MFRGPVRNFDRPYLAFMGGSEVYGRFVDHPFPDLLETELGKPCVNFGCVNAGLDSFMHDPATLRRARQADLCVLQIMGAQNLSNRFFRVHPRRNDRFLEAMPGLIELYPQVDFTEFHFNRHLLNSIRNISEDRFMRVLDELQRVWLSRMRLLIKALGGGKVVLLWMRFGPDNDIDLEHEPPLVSAEMVNALKAHVQDCVTVEIERADHAGELPDMIVGPLHAPAASHAIGPAAHHDIANALKTVLQ